MPVIESCIIESGLGKSILFCEVTQLIRYWSKNRENPEYKAYNKLVEKFWHQLQVSFTNILTKINEDYEKSAKIHDTQIELLLNLKNAPTHSRRNLRVKFEPDESVERKSEIKMKEFEDDEIFIAELDRFVNKLWAEYLKKKACQSSDKNIEFLHKLVSNFESEELFLGIAKAHRADSDLYEFYDQVLKQWLIDTPQACDSVINLIFSAIKYMEDAKKKCVLTSFIEV